MISKSTDKGIKHNNQDYILLDEKNSIYILADGVSSYSAGDIASEFASNKLYEYLKEKEFRFLEMYEIISIFLEVDRYIMELSNSDGKYSKMSTTLLLVQICDEKMHITHVGDCRVYVLNESDNTIKKLTKDHSKVQYLVDIGVLTEEDAKFHKDRHMLTDCIGYVNGVKPQYVEYNIKDNDSFIICSDGLYDYVDMEKVKDIIFKENLSNATEKIMEIAKANSKDNISFIIIRR